MAASKTSVTAMFLLPASIFGVLALLFVYSLSRGPSTTIPSTMIGKKAPEMALAPLAGVTQNGVPVPGFNSADLKGRVTIINVFASWCAPCREEHPKLLDLAKDQRVRLVGINYKDDPDNARRFLGALGNPFASIGVDQAGRAAIDWGVYGVPESFIVGRSGTILYKHVGPLTDEALKGALGEAITKASEEN